MLQGNKKFTKGEKQQLANKIRHLANTGLFRRVVKFEDWNGKLIITRYDPDYEEAIYSWEADHDSAISSITETITVNTHNGFDMTICLGMTKSATMPTGKYEAFRTNLIDLCELLQENQNDIYIVNLVAAALNARGCFIENYGEQVA